jgi:hypothetical protein
MPPHPQVLPANRPGCAGGVCPRARDEGPGAGVWRAGGPPYNPDAFGEVPCVCLRIPTGGGKTVLAAHAVPLLAREWAAMWMRRWRCGWCPAMRFAADAQGAADGGHPYRAALTEAYGPSAAGVRAGRRGADRPAGLGAPRRGGGGDDPELSHRGRGQRNVYSFSESVRAALPGHGRTGAPGVPAAPARRGGDGRGRGAGPRRAAGGLCGPAALEPGQLAGAAPSRS